MNSSTTTNTVFCVLKIEESKNDSELETMVLAVFDTYRTAYEYMRTFPVLTHKDLFIRESVLNPVFKINSGRSEFTNRI